MSSNPPRNTSYDYEKNDNPSSDRRGSYRRNDRDRPQGGRFQRRKPGPKSGSDQFTDSVNANFVSNWEETVPTFEDLNLDKRLIAGIYSAGFKGPSKIQQLAIKPIQMGRDVVAQAQSGTGKTCAFSVGILSRIDLSQHTTQALILSPTRELTLQIYQFIVEIGTRIEDLTVSVFRGGVNAQKDYDSARECPHIAVCTPGRALDLIQQGHLRIQSLSVVCLDEADKLLSDSLFQQIREIFAYFNGVNIQFLLFSATIPVDKFSIMESFLKDPVKILVPKENLTLDGIKQFYVNTEQAEHKLETLIDIYRSVNITKGIIFANSHATVDNLIQAFTEKGFGVSSIHGGMELTQRDQTMSKFRKGEVRVLIATDVLARGIDVQQVTLVFNFDLPYEHTDYIHRIGRSGRYGRGGVAINICDNNDMLMIHKYVEYYHTTIEELPSNIKEIIHKTCEVEE